MEELRSLADLLDLHGIDRNIDRLLEQRAALPELDAYKVAHEGMQQLTAARDEAGGVLKKMTRDLDKTSGELGLTEDKTNREESRLYAGGMSARDADYLRREVEMLRTKISEMEEGVLELMESREQAEAEVARLEDELATATTEKERLEVLIREEWRRIDVEVAAKEARKAEIAPLIEEDLMELYDDLRARRPDQDVVGGLEHRVCGACHLSLSAAEEVQAKREHPPRCIHCRAILVP